MGRRFRRQQAKRKQAIRVRIVWVVGLVVISGSAIWIWKSLNPTQAYSIVLPENIEQFEPATRDLIRLHAKRVEADPTDAEAMGELGLVYEANRLWQDATIALTESLRLDPQNNARKLHLAITTQKSGDFEGALEIMREVVADDPELVAAQQYLGQTLLETGDFDSAQKAFQVVVDARPNSPEGYVGLADALLRQNEVHSAATLLEKAIALDSTYRVSHYLLGTAYRKLGRDDDAARELAIGTDAEVRYLADPLSGQVAKYTVNMQSLLKQGVRLLASRQAGQAATILERALQQDPNHVTVLNNLAGAYMQIGRSDEAYSLLLKAKQLDDQKYSTFTNLAAWMASAGRFEEALANAEQAVQLAPRVAQTHFVRVNILLRLNRLDDAKAALAEALQQAPSDSKLNQIAAQIGMAH